MTNQKLLEIRQFLLSNLGLDFNKKRDSELYSKLSKAACDFNFRDTDKFIDWLLIQPMNNSQTKLLASTLTIGETYFFREKVALDYIKNVFLPGKIQDRKKLRIWSAGCSTGEEAYTLAIIIQQTIPDYKTWDITILGTDINPIFLNKARKGVYSRWSFRNTPEVIKDKYFKKLDKNSYQIIDSIKEMVTFSHLNLATNNYPSLQNNTNNYDIILCRNVLIYFSLEGTKAVVKKFYRALNTNGMLAVSPVETSNIISTSFEKVTFNGNTIFRKDLNGEYKTKLTSKKQYSFTPTNCGSSVLQISSNKLEKQRKKIQTKLNKTNSKIKLSKEIEIKEETGTYEQAAKLFEEGKPEEAKKLLLCLNSKNEFKKEEEYFLMAKIYSGINQLDEAEKWCKKVIDINKISTEAHFLLSTIYYELNQADEAIVSLNNVLFLDPEYAIAHFLLGNILLQQGQNQLGMKHFRNARKSLSNKENNEIINSGEGLTAGRLSAIIDSVLETRNDFASVI